MNANTKGDNYSISQGRNFKEPGANSCQLTCLKSTKLSSTRPFYLILRDLTLYSIDTRYNTSTTVCF